MLKAIKIHSAFLVFCAVILSGCNQNSTSGSGSPGGTLIYDNVDGNIYAYDVDSGNDKQLTNIPNAGRYLAPACSPNGDLIALDFQGYSKSGIFSSTLDLMKSDGSDLKVLSTLLQGSGSLAEGCFWSPGGSMIAFTKPEGSGSALYVINADGTGEHEVTSPCTVIAGWDPWTNAILFVRTDSAALASDLYTVNPDGSDLHRFLNRSLVTRVAWTNSPNLAYVGIADTTTLPGTLIRPWGNIYLCDLQRNLILKQVTFDDKSMPVSVLPGGSQILCDVVSDSVWWAYSLYVLDTSGIQREKVTDLDYVQPSVKLSSSGNEVAFLNLPPNAGSELYVAAIDGSSQELIAKDQSGFSFDWLPK